MAQANISHLIGTAPEFYDGQENKVLAFWNILENYFTVNEDTFNTNHKKVASALMLRLQRALIVQLVLRVCSSGE